jgi:uncharacterized membrane protein
MILYAIGMLIGNLPLDIPNMATIQKVATEASIPLAIPMMLFGCRFTRSDVSTQVKVVISGFLSVAVAIVIGYLLFVKHVPEGDKIGGFMSGMYTGGMVNAAVFSADEDEVVTASSDKIVRVWSVQTEKELIALYGHKESVTAIAADSKVSTIYTVSHDGTLQVWDYPSLTDVIQDIRRRFGKYPLTDEELIELDVI